MDWLKSERKDTFKYYRVSWPDFAVVGELEGISSGVIVRNLGSELKTSATLQTYQPLDIGNDLVRIESTSTLNGEKETIVHATLFPSVDSQDYNGAITSGTPNMYSTLLIPSKKLVRSTMTIKEGTNAIDKAAELLKELGLSVTVTPSSACLSTDHIFERDTSYLQVINWLTEFANYATVDVDGYGGVILKPYVNPSNLNPSRYLSDDENGIMSPEFSIEADWFDTPNVVVLTSSNEDETYTSVAEFDDKSSMLSTANRWEVTYTETIDDIPSQAALDEKAKSRLQDKLMYVEKATKRTPYLPDDLGEVWDCTRRLSNYHIKGSIYSKTISLEPGMYCEFLIRRFVDVG